MALGTSALSSAVDVGAVRYPHGNFFRIRVNRRLIIPLLPTFTSTSVAATRVRRRNELPTVEG